MSYDFIMMKPQADVMAEIESLEDLGERTLLRQDPAALVDALSLLFAGWPGTGKAMAAGSLRLRATIPGTNSGSARSPTIAGR